MTDEELIGRLRDKDCCESPNCNCDAAADRIEALVKKLEVSFEIGRAFEEDAGQQRDRAEAAEAALKKIAEPASVPVHTWKNGINFKKMYEQWRRIAVNRIDIARAYFGGTHE